MPPELALYPLTTCPLGYMIDHHRNDARRNEENAYLSRIDGDVGQHRISRRYTYNNQDYTVPNFQPVECLETECQPVSFGDHTFNHPVLNNPVSVVTKPNVGLIQGSSGGRNIQLALKYQF